MPTDDITDADRATLSAADFDTPALLRAVDAVDQVRGQLDDGDHGAPPQLRSDLLKLHGLAMAVFRSGARHQVPALFDLALDLEDQVDTPIEALEQIRETLGELVALRPESLLE